MRDIKAFVRRQVAPLELPAEQELKIVEEWAAQLEDAYDAIRADGLSDEDAWAQVEQQIPDWRALDREVLQAESALIRVANPEGEGAVAVAARSAHRVIREIFTRGVVRDVRASVRMLIRDPGFSLAVILTLAVCLGANAAIFTIVHGVLLRPLPVPEPDRIVALGDVYPTVSPDDILSNDGPSYFDRLEALTALEEQALFAWWFDTLVIDGFPQEIRGMRATPSLFRVLRVLPALGRTFADDEDVPGNDRAIILSHGFWQRMFGADPNVIGRDLRLGWTGRSYTIVGVMPEDFRFFDRGYDGHAGGERGPQFWIPMALTPEQKSDNARTRYGFYHIGRLRPGATVDHVRAQVDALNAANVKRFPQFEFDKLRMYTAVTPLQEALTRSVRRPLYLLWAGAAFVLLIGALNITNLSLARARGRRRELATRLALGADRLQVARQLLIEALAPATLGGVAGAALASLILHVPALTGIDDLPNAGDLRMDASVIGYIALATLIVAAVIGLAPAATYGPSNVSQVLGEDGRSGTGGRASRLVRRALVVAQVALSVILLVAATLLLTSLRHLLAVDAGFTHGGVLTATIFPPPSRYPDARGVAALSDRILERVRSLPGVQAAGLTTNVALSGGESPAAVAPAEGDGSDTETAFPSVIAVTPGYFEAMGIALLRGRPFDDGDRAEALAVAVVDERLAARLWPGEDPIGKRIHRGESGPFTVVGVVRDVRYKGLAGSTASHGAVYFPHTQAPLARRLRWIAVRSAGEPAVVARAVRSILLDIDPMLPLADIQTMDERTGRAVAPQRLAASLASLFGLVALFLSLLGIYGLLANLVARRTREIGIRIALGSSVRGIFTLVLAEGAALIGAGLLMGVAGAVALGGALEGVLFGVEPTDPLLLSGVVLATGCVALLACVLPARRATRVDPVAVLSES